MVAVSRAQALAFRLQRLGLTKRWRSLQDATGPVGLPDFPPGAAADALAPRISRPGPDVLAGAYQARSLVRMRAMRGAPVVVRPGDYETFIAGVLPPDEASMRAFLGPALGSVKAAKMTASQAVKLATERAREALSRGPLDRDRLHAELRRTLPKALLPYCRPCDSHHAHPSLVYAVALQGRLVLFPQDGGPYLLARFDRWNESDPATADPSELLRRFLHAYAPATVADFSAWAGIAPAQARAVWARLESALVSVQREGRSRPTFVLEDDLAALRASRPGAGESRLVMPGDPLLQMRDRDVLVSEPARQKIVWKNLSPRGLALIGTDLVGVVRARRERALLRVEFEGRKPAASVRARFETEAHRLAQTRGCSDVQIAWR